MNMKQPRNPSLPCCCPLSSAFGTKSKERGNVFFVSRLGMNVLSSRCIFERSSLLPSLLHSFTMATTYVQRKTNRTTRDGRFDSYNSMEWLSIIWRFFSFLFVFCPCDSAGPHIFLFFLFASCLCIIIITMIIIMILWPSYHRVPGDIISLTSLSSSKVLEDVCLLS